MCRIIKSLYFPIYSTLRGVLVEIVLHQLNFTRVLSAVFLSSLALYPLVRQRGTQTERITVAAKRGHLSVLSWPRAGLKYEMG